MKAVNLEVQWEDKLWTLNIQSLETDESMIMEMYSGTKPIALIGNLTNRPGELSTRDFQCILWLLKRRAGVMYPVEQTPKFDLFAFMNAIVEAVQKFQDDVERDVAEETAELAAKGLPPKKSRNRTPVRTSTPETK